MQNAGRTAQSLKREFSKAQAGKHFRAAKDSLAFTGIEGIDAGHGHFHFVDRIGTRVSGAGDEPDAAAGKRQEGRKHGKESCGTDNAVRNAAFGEGLYKSFVRLGVFSVPQSESAGEGHGDDAAEAGPAGLGKQAEVGKIVNRQERGAVAPVDKLHGGAAGDDQGGCSVADACQGARVEEVGGTGLMRRKTGEAGWISAQCADLDASGGKQGHDFAPQGTGGSGDHDDHDRDIFRALK